MRSIRNVLVCLGLLALTAGEAYAGPVGAMPSSLSFPDTGVGAKSGAQMITFTNNGNQMVNVMNVVIQGAHPNDFLLDFGIFQPPFSIGPGVNFTVSVQFTPTAGGVRNGTLVAQLGGNVGDTTVPLTGKGIGQKLTVTPSPINAGGSKLNVTIQKMINIQNAGGGVVKVTNITLTGQNANEFSLSGLPNFPANLNPGGQGALNVTLNFTPAFQGNMHIAQLNIANDDPNLGPTLVTQITGYGGDPKIATDVGTAAFGNLRVGLTSPPQTVNVQNSGNSGLKVSMVVLDAGPMGGGNPNDFVLDAAMIPNGTVIPAMGSLPITVAFKPGKTGMTSARVVIVSDDPNTPAKYISLLGNGTEAKPASSPQNIDFMTQTIYLAGKGTKVSFTNMGTDAYSITATTFGGMNKDWFRVNGIVVYPLKVAPGATQTIEIIPLPLGLGTGTATVTFVTDDAMTPKFDVPLKVNGIGASVMLDPAYGDFGYVGVLSSATKNFTLTNVGTDILSLKDFRFEPGMKDCSCFTVNNAPVADMMGEWPKLKPMEKLTFSVLFKPQAEGEFSAQIEIDTDDPMAKHVHVPLDGIGAQAGLKVDPVTVTFSQINTLSVSAPQNVTITNTGGADLPIASITLTGGNANQFNITPPDGGKFTLRGGEMKVIPVVYQPVSPGSHMANMVVMPTGFPPAQVKLIGSAVQPMIQVSTGQMPMNLLDFDQVGTPMIIGADSEPQQVGIKVPSTSISVQIDRVTIAGDSAFRIEQPLKTTLNAGEQTTFNVIFHPATDATKSATVSIFVKGVSMALATVTVKGTGINSTPVVRGGTGCSMGTGRAASTSLVLLLAISGIALGARRRRRNSGN